MKKTKTIIGLISVASAASIITTPLLTSCAGKEKPNDCHILSINDLHGAVAGAGETVVDVKGTTPGCLRIAREANKIKKEHPNTMFVSAGDENSGEAWSVCEHGATTYPVLSAMGIDYAAVGNHAFEWGADDMVSERYDKLGRTKNTKGKYFINSNILNLNLYQNKEWCIDESNSQFQEDFKTWYNQKVSWADPYKVVKLGPINVCLIGLTTANTLVDGNKPVTSQFSFIDYNAAVHYAKYLCKQEIGEKEFKNIDSFILLTHIDSDYKDQILSGEAVKLAAQLDTDVDAIISAHSHKFGCGKIWNNKMDKAICIGQAGTAGQYLLDTKLTLDLRAEHGKKVKEVSMEVHKIPVPEKAEDAAKEWEELQVSDDPDLGPVLTAYQEQKTVVDERVREELSECNLETKELQNQQFSGYYNSLLHSGVQVGHEYYDCEDILDHFGGWVNRAIILGYCVQNWNEIVKGSTPIPSVSMITQDSAPSQLKNGPITQREMFAIQPYDNYVNLSYLTIMQLGNIINYSLAGNPKTVGGNTGFSYTEKRQYQPDLCYFVGYDNGTLYSHQTAYNVLDEDKKPVIKSGYLCGIMPWYGIQVNLVPITQAEKTLEFTNPVTGTKSPIYDQTAKYRVKTITHTDPITKQLVLLPDIKVYDGFGDGHGIKWGSIDNTDNPTAWKSAAEWYDLECSENPRLIPIITNSFNYGGGNTQTKMFKQYSNYCILNYGLQFMDSVTPETIRDFIIAFCSNSDPNLRTKDWPEYTIPTNVPWEQISVLVKK